MTVLSVRYTVPDYLLPHYTPHYTKLHPLCMHTVLVSRVPRHPLFKQLRLVPDSVQVHGKAPGCLLLPSQAEGCTQHGQQPGSTATAHVPRLPAAADLPPRGHGLLLRAGQVSGAPQHEVLALHERGPRQRPCDPTDAGGMGRAGGSRRRARLPCPCPATLPGAAAAPRKRRIGDGRPRQWRRQGGTCQARLHRQHRWCAGPAAAAGSASACFQRRLQPRPAAGNEQRPSPASVQELQLGGQRHARRGAPPSLPFIAQPPHPSAQGRHDDGPRRVGLASAAELTHPWPLSPTLGCDLPWAVF